MKPEAVLTAQSPFELERLVTLFAELQPERTLEVGVWHGGTLWHWLQGGKVVVAIDDAMEHSEDWRRWEVEAGAKLHLIRGHSTDPLVVQTARSGGPYDFVFIDAAHDFLSVKQDWDLYSPMVRSGGVVAFHDIKPRIGYGVNELWEQIRTAPGARTVEFWQRSPYEANGLGYDHGGDRYDPGIGVVWLP